MHDINFAGLLKPILERSTRDNLIFEPLLFRLNQANDREAFINLLKDENIKITDTIYNQLCELISSRSPFKKLNEEELKKAVNVHLNDVQLHEYGVWAFYPWKNRVVHLLGKEEFLEVITNRNKQKITEPEQKILLKKKIGIIGMSVGQSIASALVIENLCSEIRIADFDTLELSNCNRIRTELENLGLSKAVIAAREISEINPFIKVVCYTEAINEYNIDSFFNKDGKIDLLIEECDTIETKLLARVAARENRTPLIMETNDRGMIDIERYDLNKDYPYLHGLLNDVTYEQLKNLTSQQKISYILKIVGALTTSTRAKVSFLELGQTISNFPQLASYVFLGSGLCADTARRILLNQFKSSGRFYVDLEEIISDKNIADNSFKPHLSSPTRIDEMMGIADHVTGNSSEKIPAKLAEELVLCAAHAPSSGNDQPWRWLYRHNSFFLFHETSRSYSFGDYKDRASYTSLGAAIENFVIASGHKSYDTDVNYFPATDKRLIARIDLKQFTGKDHLSKEDLYKNIFTRYTNRKLLPRQKIAMETLDILKEAAESVESANVHWITDESKLLSMGKIISACDRMRLLHPHGHYDFFNREIRFSNEELSSKCTGMSIEELHLPADARFALKLLSEQPVMHALNSFNGANVLRYVSVQSAVAASAIGLITMPDYSPTSFLAGGRAMQRQWLKATALSIAYHPMVGPLYFFPRIIFGNGEGLNDTMRTELTELRKEFLQIFPGDDTRGEILLFRIFIPDDEKPSSIRLPLDDIFVYKND